MTRLPWKTKIFFSVVCLLILILGLWMPQTPESVVSAVGCTGFSCDGLNPSTMGCGSDATTGTRIVFTNGVAEHRKSTACDAKWERTRLTSGANKYAAGSIRFGCANYCYAYSVSSPAKISSGEQVYTPMAGNLDMPTRACGKLLDDGPIFVPIPISATYCSSADS